MTRLLISVRNAAEAQIALDERVDLIDVKEPSRGSLGAADGATIREIATQIAGRVPISAALGELLEAQTLSANLAGRLDYAKFGLAGCAARPDWFEVWQAAIASLPAGTTPVAVAYADWQAAAALDPWEVLEHASRLSRGGFLLDTFQKSRGTLLDHVSLTELSQILAAAKERNLLAVIAGSLDVTRIEEVLSLQPDVIGVRGAACAGGRSDGLDAARVRRLVTLVHESERNETQLVASSQLPRA